MVITWKKCVDDAILNHLIDMYQTWCNLHQYEHISADELLHKLICESECDIEHVNWLEAYIKLWDITAG